jgi:pyrimidine-nucleoside phosphorylase
MTFLSQIEAKRDGAQLPAPAFASMVNDFVAGRIPDYQMAAMLMAIFFRGLTASETRALTLAMRDSGRVLQFPADPRPVVDKHSTGGVGDKVSLPLAPLLACLGFRVPMISGRGLGITGGTLDKLESIPGLGTQLDPERIIEQVQRIGVAMAGQTAAMVPADRLLYALRDVTGTVPSIPLIASSILSKKLAEGLQALVMDVKFGRAAFMPNLDQARALAEAIITLAGECGLPTRALLSDMSTPLGRAAGNWLEVVESVACLEGRGPPDLEGLVIECAATLLHQTGRASDLPIARLQARNCLASREPRRKWDELLAAQGADLEAFGRKLGRDHASPVVRELKADREGYVHSCDARLIGEVVRDLGAGRSTKEMPIDPDVGLDRLAKPGDSVGRDALLCRIHGRSEDDTRRAAERLRAAFGIGSAKPVIPDLLR